MLLIEIKRRFKNRIFFLSLCIIICLSILMNLTLMIDKNFIKSLDSEKLVVGEDILKEGLMQSKAKGGVDNRETKIIRKLIDSYPGILYKEKNIKDIPLEYGSNFYELYKEKFYAITSLYDINTEYAQREIEDIEVPFIHYNNVYIYNIILSNLEKIYILIIFAVGFFAADTYSESKEDGSMEIIMTTKLYRKNMYLRLVPNIIYGFILSTISTIISIWISIYIIGFDSFYTSFQMVNLFTYGNINVGSVFAYMFILVNLGVIGTSLMVSLTSLLFDKVSDSIILISIISIGYMILNKLIKNNILRGIISFIPISSAYGFSYFLSLDFLYGVRLIHGVMVNNLIVISIFGILNITRLYKCREL